MRARSFVGPGRKQLISDPFADASDQRPLRCGHSGLSFRTLKTRSVQRVQRTQSGSGRQALADSLARTGPWHGTVYTKSSTDLSRHGAKVQLRKTEASCLPRSSPPHASRISLWRMPSWYSRLQQSRASAGSCPRSRLAARQDRGTSDACEFWRADPDMDAGAGRWADRGRRAGALRVGDPVLHPGAVPGTERSVQAGGGGFTETNSLWALQLQELPLNITVELQHEPKAADVVIQFVLPL